MLPTRSKSASIWTCLNMLHELQKKLWQTDGQKVQFHKPDGGRSNKCGRQWTSMVDVDDTYLDWIWIQSDWEITCRGFLLIRDSRLVLWLYFMDEEGTRVICMRKQLITSGCRLIHCSEIKYYLFNTITYLIKPSLEDTGHEIPKRELVTKTMYLCNFLFIHWIACMLMCMSMKLSKALLVISVNWQPYTDYIKYPDNTQTTYYKAYLIFTLKNNYIWQGAGQKTETLIFLVSNNVRTSVHPRANLVFP